MTEEEEQLRFAEFRKGVKQGIISEKEKHDKTLNKLHALQDEVARYIGAWHGSADIGEWPKMNEAALESNKRRIKE